MKSIFGNELPLPDNQHPFRPMDTTMVLGRTLRFGGHANPEWTVLHHSMLVALLWLRAYGPEGVEHALLHDLHEAITGDIPSPVKAAIGRKEIDRVQDELDLRVYKMVESPLPDTTDKALVKIVDYAALFIEGHYIGAPGHLQHIVDTGAGGKDPGVRRDILDVVESMCPEVAKEMVRCGFLNIQGE